MYQNYPLALRNLYMKRMHKVIMLRFAGVMLLLSIIPTTGVKYSQ